MASVIVIATQKGGAGKTTLTINLGQAFKRAGFRTLLVDADPQRSLRDWHATSGGTMATVIAIDQKTIARDIKAHLPHYDFILIDVPGRLSIMETESIKAADLVVIPCQPCASDVNSTAATVELVRERQAITDGSPPAVMIANRVEPGTVLAGQIDEALAQFGFPVLSARIQKRQAYSLIYNTGGTVFDQPKSPAALETEALRLAIVEALEHAEA